MRMMGTPNLIADTMDCGLSYSVISYLKKLSQQVKAEQHGSRSQNTEKHVTFCTAIDFITMSETMAKYLDQLPIILTLGVFLTLNCKKQKNYF